MKHAHKILLPILLAAFIAPPSAHADNTSLLPRKKQKPAVYLKLNYYTPSYDYLNALSTDLNDGAFHLLSHSSIGVAYRIPLWRKLYIQPELHYGIATDWQEAALKPNFFSRLTHAFNIREYSYFDFPLFVGLRWQPITLFAARAYCGPLMQFSLHDKQFGIIGQYSLACGAGLDLLNFISIDLGYRIGMHKLTFLETTATYFLSLSLKL